MPRHVVRDRFRQEEDINALIDSMRTYEEVVPPTLPEEISWSSFIRFPEPGKILSSDYFDKYEFTTRKSPFFRVKGDPSVDEEHNSEEEDDNETDSSSISSGTQSAKEGTDFESFQLLDSYYYVQRVVIVSRLYVLLLQFFGANFLKDYHTDAFRGADYIIEKGVSPVGDFIIRYLLAGLRRWDAQHFLFISDVDYIYEKSLAFMPGFVGVVNIVRFFIIAYSAILFEIEVPMWIGTTIAALVVNLVSFHLTAIMLYLVCYQLSRSVKVALMSVTLFAFNPASIFFTAVYSESVYMLVTTTALLMIISSCHVEGIILKVAMTCMSSLFFGGSTLIRSNGLLNLGYAMWYMLASVLWIKEDPIPEARVLQDKLSAVRNRRAREELTRDLCEYKKMRNMQRKVCRLVAKNRFMIVTLMIVALLCSIILISVVPPFSIYGTIMSQEYCDPDSQHSQFAKEYANRTGTTEVVAGQVDRLSFCKNMYAFDVWPKYYGLIQYRYWQVGLFRYWEIRKIPCFLLAAPALIISFIAIRNTFDDVFRVNKWRNIFVLFGRLDHLFPYAVHSAVLMFVAIFVINTEVYTRIIFSSSPFLYVFLAKWLDGLTKGNTIGNRMSHYNETYSLVPMFITRHIWNSGWSAKLFIVYFVAYFVFGSIAHAAWLPFT